MKKFFNKFIKERWYLHFLITTLISTGLYPLFIYMNHSVEMGTLDKLLMIIIAGGIAGLINLLREWYYDNESIKKDGVGNYDRYDVMWGFIGGLVGGITSALIF